MVHFECKDVSKIKVHNKHIPSCFVSLLMALCSYTFTYIRLRNVNVKSHKSPAKLLQNAIYYKNVHFVLVDPTNILNPNSILFSANGRYKRRYKITLQTALQFDVTNGVTDDVTPSTLRNPAAIGVTGEFRTGVTKTFVTPLEWRYQSLGMTLQRGVTL